MGRNWQWSFEQGRQKRFEAERAAALRQEAVAAAPMHSYDATMQAEFNRGWASPTAVEIHRYINPPKSIGEQLRANKRLRELLNLGNNSCQ